MARNTNPPSSTDLINASRLAREELAKWTSEQASKRPPVSKGESAITKLRRARTMLPKFEDRLVGDVVVSRLARKR